LFFFLCCVFFNCLLQIINKLLSLLGSCRRLKRDSFIIDLDGDAFFSNVDKLIGGFLFVDLDDNVDGV